MVRVIVIDDNMAFLAQTAAALRDVDDLDLLLFASYEEFQEWHGHKADCVGCSVLWIDIALPGKPGWECLRECVNRGVVPKRVVFCSGVVDLASEEYSEFFDQLRKDTQLVLLKKPVTREQIREAVFVEVP